MRLGVVPLIAGAIVEVLSGVAFYLYGTTSSQLSAFHGRLEVPQPYLLANSICEASALRKMARRPRSTSCAGGRPQLQCQTTLWICDDEACRCDRWRQR
jgi:hypothetical protein